MRSYNLGFWLPIQTREGTVLKKNSRGDVVAIIFKLENVVKMRSFGLVDCLELIGMLPKLGP